MRARCKFNNNNSKSEHFFKVDPIVPYERQLIPKLIALASLSY